MPVADIKPADLSDSDYDELVSDGGAEDDQDSKPTANDSTRLLKGALQRPRHVTFNTKHLHGELPPQIQNPLISLDLIHFGNIDLEAAYQRDVVWSEQKMIGLIQSLFLVSSSHPVFPCSTHDE